MKSQRKLRNLKNTHIKLYSMHTSSSKYVCFDCRTCFHKWGTNGEYTCVNCKGKVFSAGSAFRAPRRRDIKEWAKLEVLIREKGVQFHYCGGGGQTKGLTVNDAKSIRRTPRSWDERKARDIGKVNYAMRPPGSGKRVTAKTWYSGWHAAPTYELPAD